jgi:hypothetical protein
VTEMTEEQKKERSNALRKAYSNATTRLREAHRTEFDELYSAEAEALGVDFTPKPSAEQKAEQQMEKLLHQYPHLREKIVEPEPASDYDPYTDENITAGDHEDQVAGTGTTDDLGDAAPAEPLDREQAQSI